VLLNTTQSLATGAVSEPVYLQETIMRTISLRTLPFAHIRAVGIANVRSGSQQATCPLSSVRHAQRNIDTQNSDRIQPRSPPRHIPKAHRLFCGRMFKQLEHHNDWRRRWALYVSTTSKTPSLFRLSGDSTSASSTGSEKWPTSKSGIRLI
jgi:hypothetical protein